MWCVWRRAGKLGGQHAGLAVLTSCWRFGEAAGRAPFRAQRQPHHDRHLAGRFLPLPLRRHLHPRLSLLHICPYFWLARLHAPPGGAAITSVAFSSEVLTAHDSSSLSNRCDVHEGIADELRH